MRVSRGSGLAVAVVVLFVVASTGEATDSSKRRSGRRAAIAERRSADNDATTERDIQYSVNCYGANSSFAIPECNCLGGTPDPRLSGRDKIRIVVGSWFAAAMDAFLLKVAIEEVLGFPVELVPDGINTNPSKLTGPKSVYDALATGSVHIYPEVRACEPASLQAKPPMREGKVES